MSELVGDKGKSGSSRLFALLALGLVVSIYFFRMAPASRQLDHYRNLRQGWAASHEATKMELEQLNVLSAALGTDNQVTERYLRQENFAKTGEFTVSPGDSGR